MDHISKGGIPFHPLTRSASLKLHLRVLKVHWSKKKKNFARNPDLSKVIFIRKSRGNDATYNCIDCFVVCNALLQSNINCDQSWTFMQTQTLSQNEQKSRGHSKLRYKVPLLPFPMKEGSEVVRRHFCVMSGFFDLKNFPHFQLCILNKHDPKGSKSNSKSNSSQP